MDQNQDSPKDRSGRPLQKDDRVLHSAASPQPERMDAGCVIDQTRPVNEILRNRVVGRTAQSKRWSVQFRDCFLVCAIPLAQFSRRCC